MKTKQKQTHAVTYAYIRTYVHKYIHTQIHYITLRYVTLHYIRQRTTLKELSGSQYWQVLEKNITLFRRFRTIAKSDF